MSIQIKSILNIVSLLLVNLVSNAQWTRIPGYNHYISSFFYSGNRLLVSDEQSSSTYQLMDSSKDWSKITDKSGFSFTYDFCHTDSFNWIATQTGFLYSKQSEINWQLAGDSVKAASYPLATSLAVLPQKGSSSPYTLFSGTLGIGFFHSFDAGVSWQEIDSSRFHNFDVLDLKTHMYANNKVDFYMINLLGVFESPDEGISWIRSDSTTSVKEPIKLWFLNNQWFLSALDGLYRKDTSLNNWEKCTSYFSNGYDIRAMVSMDSIIYAGSVSKGILESTDNGASWALCDSFAPGKVNGICDIVGMAFKGDTLIVGTSTNGLWKSRISDISNSINSIYRKPAENIFYQNYPNPFRLETSFSVETSGCINASIDIYNINGQLIRNLIRSQKICGSGSFTWDGRDTNGMQVKSGVYVAALKSATQMAKIKLIVTR